MGALTRYHRISHDRQTETETETGRTERDTHVHVCMCTCMYMASPVHEVDDEDGDVAERGAAGAQVREGLVAWWRCCRVLGYVRVRWWLLFMWCWWLRDG